jgi:MOB kinase activator 1
MDDPKIFPQHYGEPFPPNFRSVIESIFKRLFRVYAHIYHSHFKHVCALGEEAHLNTCFKHFIYFTEVMPLCAKKAACPACLNTYQQRWE